MNLRTCFMRIEEEVSCSFTPQTISTSYTAIIIIIIVIIIVIVIVRLRKFYKHLRSTSLHRLLPCV